MARTATLIGALALVAVLATPQLASAGPLWDYVHAPDPTFAWADTGYRLTDPKNPTWTGILLNVTSQTWLTPQQVSLSVWHHQLMVFVPKDLSNSSMAAIYNTNGDNPLPAKPPGLSDPEVNLISQLAVATKTITSIIWQIPNQPVVYAADPKHQERSEDAAVAFSWFEFIHNGVAPDYIIEMPMTKAVVRGMDAVEQFMKQHNGHVIDKWLVSGASKRGWTSWLVGGVDARVAAIAPIVMDMLNFQPNVLHMYKAYGGWTFAFADYYSLNITEYLDSDLIKPLFAIIDPLMYKENLTMPKLVIDATGDEFFMPDDDHFWWGDLEGETYRLMVSNADHSMATGLGPLYMSLSAFYQSLVIDAPRPVINWTMASGSGTISAVSNVKADQAVMRWATTRNADQNLQDKSRRDFRLFKGATKNDPCHTITVPVFGEACFNPVLWIGEDLLETQVSNGWQYTASQDMPPEGEWRGFFVDFFFPGPSEGFTFRFTTQVSIIPQEFPFPPCSGKGCLGFLV